MFCSHCGAEIKDGARRCGQCGQPLEDKNQTKKSTAASRIHRITVEGDEIIKADARPEPGVHPVDDMTEQLPDMSAVGALDETGQLPDLREIAEGPSSQPLSQDTVKLPDLSAAGALDETGPLPDLREIAEGPPSQPLSQDTVKLPDLSSTGALDEVDPSPQPLSQDTVKLPDLSAAGTLDATASRATVKLDAVSRNTIDLGDVQRDVRQSDAVSANTVKLGNLNKGQAHDAVSQDTVKLDDMDFDTLDFDEMPLDTMDLDDEDEAMAESGPDTVGSSAGAGALSGQMAEPSQPSSGGAAKQNSRPVSNPQKHRPSGATSGQPVKPVKPVKSGKPGRPARPASKGDSSSGIWAAVGAVLVLAVVIAAIVLMFRTKVGGPSYTELIQSGNEYYTEGNYDKATELYKKAVESFPEKPEGYAGLADVYVAAQNTEKAADILQQGYERTRSAQLKTKLEGLQVGESDSK